MLSYRKLAMRVLGRPLNTGGGNNSPRPASQRAAAFALTAAMLITLTAPAFADTWCIENGNITVKAGDTEGTNKVSQGSIIDREDTNTIITNSDKDTASSNTVTIDAGNDKVEVTLDNVNIKAGSGSALTSKGDVTLTLKGDNHLTGGISDTGNYGRNGIASTGSLTITGGENGSLTAQGGSGADGGHGGHGIYSNGSLTISGGENDSLTAQGGSGANGITSSGAIRARICAKVHAPVPVKVRITGASRATAMLQRRLYVAIVATLAPSMPPITTAAIATGASTQTIAPCARIPFRGRRSRKIPTQATT